MYTMPTPEIHPLSGARSGWDAYWSERRVDTWLMAFMVLGIALRLVRFALMHPLWRDEAYVAWNVLDRDFAGLTRPLDYQQVCPLFFLWAEKGISTLFGFHEWSLRLLPTLAAIGSLFLFRHVAGRLLQGTALVIAVGFLAIAYTPIRHGGEIKPYATDFLVALALIGLAVEWLRRPERTVALWGLAVLGPLAVGFSNPAIFIAASVGLVLAAPVMRARKSGVVIPFTAFCAGTSAMFLVLLSTVNAAQSASVMDWMRVYWSNAFPPKAPMALLVWLLKVHTSHIFAYPAGGDVGASTLTTVLVAVAVVAFLRRGSKRVLALLLTPFALGLGAAFLGRYPYGGSARTMQYLAPSILLLGGLGAALLLDRVQRPAWRRAALQSVMGLLVAVGLGMLAWDVAHPYKTDQDQAARAFARSFWEAESADSEVLCARTDLHLPLDAIAWRGDRAAVYLCHQAMYSPRHRAHQPVRLNAVSETHPLRVVVFGETGEDPAAIQRWMAANACRFRLRSRHERVLNKGLRRGKATAEDRYVVYELAPATERVCDRRRAQTVN